MRRLRESRGFTAIEVLLASTLMVVVLMATLTMLDSFGAIQRRAGDLSASVDRARTGVDRLTRELRNATPQGGAGSASGTALLRATATDLVMRRVNPFGTSTDANPYAVGGVRWCLNAERGELHRQQGELGLPAAACPDPAWKDTIVATDIVNGARPLFSYDGRALEEITSVGTFLALDRNVERDPAEVTLTSGVHLRNQNRRPTATFTAVAMPGRSIQLNGSASVDPEGGMLTFAWADGDRPLPATGPATTYTAPADGPRRITLTVTDAGGLSASAARTVVALP